MTAASRPSRRGSTPPTTLEPPPKGVTATRRAEHSSSSACTSSCEAGYTTASGALEASPSPDANEVRIALAERVRDAREPVLAHPLLPDQLRPARLAPRPAAPGRAGPPRRGSRAVRARRRRRMPGGACRAPCLAARWRPRPRPSPTSACAGQGRSFDREREPLEGLVQPLCGRPADHQAAQPRQAAQALSWTSSTPPSSRSVPSSAIVSFDSDRIRSNGVSASSCCHSSRSGGSAAVRVKSARIGLPRSEVRTFVQVGPRWPPPRAGGAATSAAASAGPRSPPRSGPAALRSAACA